MRESPWFEDRIEFIEFGLWTMALPTLNPALYDSTLNVYLLFYVLHSL